MGKTRPFSNDKTTYYDVYYQKKQNLTTSGYISNTTITYNNCINPNFKLACRCCKKTIVIFEDYETYIQRNFPYTNNEYKIIPVNLVDQTCGALYSYICSTCCSCKYTIS